MLVQERLIYDLAKILIYKLNKIEFIFLIILFLRTATSPQLCTFCSRAQNKKSKVEIKIKKSGWCPCILEKFLKTWLRVGESVSHRE